MLSGRTDGLLGRLVRWRCWVVGPTVCSVGWSAGDAGWSDRRFARSVGPLASMGGRTDGLLGRLVRWRRWVVGPTVCSVGWSAGDAGWSDRRFARSVGQLATYRPLAVFVDRFRYGE